jgi:integrase/recombinase XerC
MDKEARAWLPRFLAHLTIERRLSPHTDISYRSDLQRFVDYCGRNEVRNWRSVDSQHVRMFAAAEFRQGSSPRTIQRRLSALRSFFNFMLRECALDANPAVGVQAPKARKRLPDTMDVDLMTRLLEFRTDTQLGLRDKAIMELFYSSGSCSIRPGCVSPSSSG